ncbi:MAG: chromate transporter [Lachnospiraceae bacterium]|nr:chromate transporter [Lachnospiraceae bacterium]
MYDSGLIENRKVITKQERKGLLSMLGSFFGIGLIGFGGGNALVPVIRNTVVEKRKLISDQSYHDKVFIANITPGALPVEVACGVGREVAGRLGMVLAPVAMALPGAALVVLMLACFSRLGQTARSCVQLFSVAVSVYIIYLLVSYIITMLREAAEAGKRREHIAIFLVTTLFVSGSSFCEMVGIDTTYIPEASPAAIMICVLVYAILTKREKGGVKMNLRGLALDESWCGLILVAAAIPAVILCSEALEFLGRGMLSAVLSFGGGDAYLGIADDLFVESGMFTTDEFYVQLVTVANILPGSILVKMLTGMGYLLGAAATGSVWGGIAVAVAGFGCATYTSCGTYLLVENMYMASKKMAIFKFIKEIVKPIVAAFMVAVIVSLVQKDINILTSLF